MASQSDKKEEFRRYLEKGKVLSVLTTVLTDLFEMEKKPDDPLEYMTQRFTETLSKPPSNGPQKDVPMPDAPLKQTFPDQPMPPAPQMPAAPQMPPAPQMPTAPQMPAPQPQPAEENHVSVPPKTEGQAVAPVEEQPQPQEVPPVPVQPPAAAPAGNVASTPVGGSNGA